MGDTRFDLYDAGAAKKLEGLDPEALLSQVGDDIPEDAPEAFKAYLAKRSPRTRARVKAIVALYDGNASRMGKVIGICRQNLYRYLSHPAVREAIADRHPSQRMKELIAEREELQAFWSSMARDDSRADKDRLKASELLGRASMMFVEKRVIQDETTLGAALRDLAGQGSPSGHGAGEAGPANPSGDADGE